MAYFYLGFFTGLSLILAIGAQNIFVIEQGLKRQFTFLVCFVCSISDLVLIFIGILIFRVKLFECINFTKIEIQNNVLSLLTT